MVRGIASQPSRVPGKAALKAQWHWAVTVPYLFAPRRVLFNSPNKRQVVPPASSSPLSQYFVFNQHGPGVEYVKGQTTACHPMRLDAVSCSQAWGTAC